MDQVWLWVGFNAFVLAMLAIDLGVFHRSAHEVSRHARPRPGAPSGWRSRSRSTAASTTSWAEQAGLEFLAGYLIEKALSVDNIFVFVLIFTYFRVPAEVPAPGAVLGHPRRAGHARRR